MSYALLVRLEKGISIFYLTHVDGKSRKRKSRKGMSRRWEVGGGRSSNPLPPAFDPQAFVEAISAATANIA